MSDPDTGTVTADSELIRTEERQALLRLARAVAIESARANGRKDDAGVAADYVAFILQQAMAARDLELRSESAARAATPEA